MTASRRRCINKPFALRNDDPDATAAFLIQADAHDMVDARPFLAAADTALAQGDQARADALVKMALRLQPVDPRIQQRAGRYWILRRQTGNSPLASRPGGFLQGTRCELFPLLLKLAEDPRSQSAFETLVASPPSWWDFFSPRSLNTRQKSIPFSNSTPYDASRSARQSQCLNGKATSLGSKRTD